jgi:hypothetical protein
MIGRIRNRRRARQILDYSHLVVGRHSPGDVDGVMEIGGWGFFVVEMKHREAEVPRGQRRTLEALATALVKTGYEVLFVVASHDVDNPAADVNAADAKVRERFDSGTLCLTRVRESITLSECLREWIECHSPSDEEE